MSDTSPEIAEFVRQKLMARSNEERFLMGVQSFEAARAMVLASLPKDLPPEELKRQFFNGFMDICCRSEAQLHRSEIFGATTSNKFLSSVRSDIEDE